MTPTFPPLDAGRVKFLAERGWRFRAGDDLGSRLTGLLLGIGGHAVHIVDCDTELRRMLERGEQLPGKSRAMRGVPCRCHENSAHLWYGATVDRDIRVIGVIQLATGYALSADGLWRSHSWCVATKDGGKPLVLETTVKRVRYYGYRLTREEALIFHRQNCDF